MRFKQFLSEGVSDSYKKISEVKAIELAKTNFNEALALDKPLIVRGMRQKDKRSIEYYSISNITGRKSANTSNEYTVLVDNLPAWKEYPKRSESLICTNLNNLGYTWDYGETFIILPENGANIGVCSSYDFWNGFGRFTQLGKAAGYTSHPLMGIFNEILRSIFQDAGFKLRHDNKDFDQIKQALDAGTKYLRTAEPETLAREDKSFFKSVIDGKETMLEFIEKVLDPTINGFKLVKYKNLVEFSGNKELWFSGPALAFGNNVISDEDEAIELYQEFREKVKNS